MLSIRPIGCSKEQVNYYANLGREDYYTRGGESPGIWIGDVSGALGLEGQVAGIELRNLLLGFSADGKRKLVQNAGASNRRSAFDLTWSVPKSVSALWSQVDLEHRLQIEQACEKAVRKAASTLQQLCGVTRRGHDGIEIQHAQLAMALFRHETARGITGQMPDPNLHWHLVVPNIAVRPDGTTGAFDARKLFGKNMKMALGALFRAELSKQLLALRLDSYRPTRPTQKEPVSWFELEVVPQELITELSKRRREIESWLRKNGLVGAKHAEKAALATRHTKGSYSRAELFANWHKIGQEFEFTHVQVQEWLQLRTPPIFDLQEESVGAITRAITRLTDHQARFTKTELLRFVAEEAQCRGIGIDIVVAEVENTLTNSSEIVHLGFDGDQAVITTPEMLEVEKQLFRTAARLSRKHSHGIAENKIESSLNNFSTLREEQADAIRYLTSGSDLSLVNGIAGSGKTYMLTIAGKIWRDAGLVTFGTCLAAKAAQTLQQETGIESYHVHQLLYQIEKGHLTLDNKTVLVVDEAGMIGTKRLNKLLQLAETSGAKIAMIGDHRQLQAISAGAPFRAVAERVGSMEMNQITRQRESWARESVRDFRDGKAASALASYWQRGLLSISEDRDEAIQALVQEWRKVVSGQPSLQENQIFSGTNMDVALINQACQNLLLKMDHIGGTNIQIGSSRFYIHDRIVITRNLHSLGLRNGSLGSITNIDGKNQAMHVLFDDGYQVWIDLNEFDDLQLSYAVSTHKGQGQTVENAFVLVGGCMTDRELTYVQSSRARGETRLFTDRITSGHELDQLIAQMAQSRAKSMAHDLERVAT
ncbi:MAG: MobF family relaxase [Planctomycetota bacterium]